MTNILESVRELARLQALGKAVVLTAHEFDFAALAAEMVRLREDAERYRWLREANLQAHDGMERAIELGDAHMDAAIDAARKEKDRG